MGLKVEFSKAFGALGCSIVTEQAYTSGDQDFSAQLGSIRDAGAEAIYIPGYYTDVGNIALQSIDPVSRSAEFAVVLGDRRCWGKGYSKEAARLILDHGFSELNLNRVHCGTAEGNRAMRKLAASLGMKEEGRRRQAFFKGGAFRDVLEYGILRNEYLRRFPAGREGSRG